MEKNKRIKRYVVFIAGMFVNALGVAAITKASLGTSPISSVPYVLCLIFPLSFGIFTDLVNVALILGQILILRKDFKLVNLLQVPAIILFGWFLDLWMALLTFQPEAYAVKIVYLLIGCVILGTGVYMEVLADVVMLPGEAFCRAIVTRWKTEFGITKIGFDTSMMLLAGILSLTLVHKLVGLREGTLVAAFLVGFVARTLGKRLAFLPEKLFGDPESTEELEEKIVSAEADI